MRKEAAERLTAAADLYKKKVGWCQDMHGKQLDYSEEHEVDWDPLSDSNEPSQACVVGMLMHVNGGGGDSGYAALALCKTLDLNLEDVAAIVEENDYPECPHDFALALWNDDSQMTRRKLLYWLRRAAREILV